MDLDNTTLAFMKYRKPIATFCRMNHRWSLMEAVDLEAEMHEVLCKCVVAYDPDKGAQFGTVLFRAMQNRLFSIIRANNAQKRSFVEVPHSSVDDDDPESLIQSLDTIMANRSYTEASTEETFFAIMSAADLMTDPKKQTRMRSARQFSHVS